MTRAELDAINIPLLTQQDSTDRITGAELRQARSNDLDYVDQQDSAVLAAAALDASSKANTAQSNAILAIDSVFAALVSGNTWNGTRSYVLANGDVELTLTTSRNSGELFFKQSSGGGDSLTINGQVLDINLGGDYWTKVSFGKLGTSYVFVIDKDTVQLEDMSTFQAKVYHSLTDPFVDTSTDPTLAGATLLRSATVNAGDDIAIQLNDFPFEYFILEYRSSEPSITAFFDTVIHSGPIPDGFEFRALFTVGGKKYLTTFNPAAFDSGPASVSFTH